MIRTYVIDNGQHYSDHEIFFVETEATIEQVGELIALIREGIGFYDAVVAHIDGRFIWREGKSMRLEDYAERVLQYADEWSVTESKIQDILAAVGSDRP